MKRSNEAGISIVEVLIATFILFFVIMALAGLLTMAFAMTTTARKQTEATGVVQELIEEVRGLAWENIGTVGGDPEGVLASSETTVSGTTTYTVSRTISWVDDVMDNDPQTTEGDDSDRQDYKSITIGVAWRNPNGTDSTITAQTSIRRPWASTNPPTVEFTSLNVSPNSIVYAGSVIDEMAPSGESSLVVQATASDLDDSDGKIASLIFYVDGRLLRNPAQLPVAASWSPAVQTCTRPESGGYPWNTLALDESGTPLYPDGLRELKVEAWDNSAARDFKIINVTIDNFPPSAPTGLVSLVSTANASCFDTIRLVWTGARDGTDWANAYEIGRHSNGTTSTVQVPGTITEMSDSPLTPFSWYRHGMRALSVRNLPSAWAGPTPAIMTRPKLTATASGSGNTRSATLTWSAPTFSCTDLHYHVYYLKSATWNGANLVNEVAATAAHNYTANTWTSAAFPKADQYFYQMRASLFIGGTHYSIYSNVVGPSPLSGDYPIP